ncbi:SMEK domain-containing protein, partial [Trichocoleus sp. ST-U3]
MRSRNRINQLISLFLWQIKTNTAMGQTDINKISETILIPLFTEVYGYRELKNLNRESLNYPGIDLGDETARVAFQITSTSDSEKVKHTLRKFTEYKLYEKYDKLIIYILTEKQKSYSGTGYEEIIQGKFTFDKDKDIQDYRDLLKEVNNFQCIDKVRRVESILEAHFGEGRTLTEWEVVDNVERVVNEYTQLFVGREEESKELDKFLHENSSGVILVTAGAGFGKTALLANWVNAWRDKDCFIAYHFFTQRYGSVKSAYRNLLRQLYIYYKPTYEQIPNDEEDLKIRLSNLLREYAAREGEPLIIVIDGLDEAKNTFSPPFPTPLPENVFVIASARAEKGEEHKYLEYWTDNSQMLPPLERLSCGAIAQWLRNTDELAAFAEDTDFVAQLDETTEGFPLYLR